VRAHASIVASEPADSATVAAAPEQLRLQWDEPVSSRLSTVELRDAGGRLVREVQVRTDRPDARTLIADLGALKPGTYGVLWKAFSEADGHFSRGLIVFGIGASARADEQRSVNAAAGPAAGLEATLRALYFLALLGAIGGGVAGHCIMGLVAPPRPFARSLIEDTRSRAFLFVASSCVVAFGAGLGLLTLQLLEIGLDGAWPLLSEGRWGRFWTARQALTFAGACLGMIAWRLRHLPVEKDDPLRRSTSRLPAGGTSVCVGAVVVLQALSSHAAADGAGSPIAADVLHVVAAGAWAGGLVGLLVALPVREARRAPDVQEFVLHAFRTFSPVAAISVLVLVITGLYAAARETPGVGPLTQSPYGETLALKLLLVLVMGALGLCSFSVLHRGLVEKCAARLLGRTWRLPLPLRLAPRLLAAEAAVAVLIVGSVGLLTALPPARVWAAQAALQDNETSGWAAVKVDDLIVSLSVKPNRPGQNVFAVLAGSTRRPAPAPVMRLLLRFTYLDEETGRISASAEKLEPGRYLLTGGQLAMAGRWRIEVVVRRAGLEDSVARFDWSIGAGARHWPVPPSNAWIATAFAAGAVGFLLIMSPLAPILIRRRTDRTSAPRDGAAVPQVGLST
jgi:copper transport protein